MTNPILLSTWSFGQRGNNAAWPGLRGGGGIVDAVERVCITVEDDPEVDSVGYGGLPDATGRMSLDGAIMLSPARRGSVCMMRRYRHPVSVARRVMDETTCVLLAGAGADAFARAHEFEEKRMLSPAAADKYAAWKRDPKPVDCSQDSGLGAGLPADEAQYRNHDTVGVIGIDASGELGGACSTSGLAYKLPGRVGDSPIIGHGLYVDPKAGAVTATGNGELIMGVCGSFLVAESMRGGKGPAEAICVFLERVASSFDVAATDQVAIIALHPDGHWASGALRRGYRTSVYDHEGSRIVDPDVVLIDEPMADTPASAR
jgi:N4-(beta-N-acetylglucosaminyl)-L-asparaginase